MMTAWSVDSIFSRLVCIAVVVLALLITIVSVFSFPFAVASLAGLATAVIALIDFQNW